MQVELSGLGHRYGEGAALFTGLDLVLVPGRTYAVTGSSGSGKSTLLAILAGMLQPWAGDVRSEGVRQVRWVFQNPSGVPRRSVLDHVVLGLLLRGWRRKDAIPEADRLLDEFGLGDRAHLPFAALSGGEAQRLMLARAVACAPHLLLVDEPTAQLDQVTAQGVNACLGRIANRGAIVVVATHDRGTRDACTDVVDLSQFRPRHP
ncbi:ABC transporter ATP-binding protein [Cellulomonas sp. Y8]|uniref:ABC transporter ATP-binding protein n=1 Tax=Cellulomonas sp. Y8 TaxID=2591145 RepID=UPI0011CA538D|nr:ATP-binding cassette domain-containing protein [Cellulomonas sp. Y8]